MFFEACFDELEKISAVSDEEARRSLDRLDQLEKSKPTGGQVARYGALGAGAGALGHVVSRAIEGGAVTRRSALGAAAAGAIGMGAVPLVRGALDRHAEKGTLKSYLHQGEKDAGFLDSAKSLLTKDIPGTPDIGKVTGAIKNLAGASPAAGAAGGASKGFAAFQKARDAQQAMRH